MVSISTHYYYGVESARMQDDRGRGRGAAASSRCAQNQPTTKRRTELRVQLRPKSLRFPAATELRTASTQCMPAARTQCMHMPSLAQTLTLFTISDVTTVSVACVVPIWTKPCDRLLTHSSWWVSDAFAAQASKTICHACDPQISTSHLPRHATHHQVRATDRHPRLTDKQQARCCTNTHHHKVARANISSCPSRSSHVARGDVGISFAS